MSISNGKQKRSTNNKKGQCLSTVAVYPILQTVQKSSMLDLAKGVQNDVSTRYIRGQCIRGQSVAYVFLNFLNNLIQKKFFSLF